MTADPEMEFVPFENDSLAESTMIKLQSFVKLTTSDCNLGCTLVGPQLALAPAMAICTGEEPGIPT